MCWTTQARRRRALRSRANSTMRSNARRRVRTRSTGVISSSSVRIGLICSAEPSHACAEPIRPPAQVLQGVDREPISASRSRLDRLQRVLGAEPLGRGAGRDQRTIPWPPQPLRQSQTWIRSPSTPDTISGPRAWSAD